MPANVEPEEAEALQELLREPAGHAPERSVRARDFRRPLRMSRLVLNELRSLLQKGFASIEEAVRGFYGEGARCEIADLGEASADTLVESLRPPLAVGRFSLGGQPAWVVWPTGAALAAIGAVFGEDGDESGEARPPSGVERRLLRDFYSALVAAVAAPLGRQPGPLEIATAPHEVGSWRDGEPQGADLHRVCLSLTLEQGAQRSTVHLYLPGFHTGTARGAEPAAALPGHLAPVDVRASVVLGTAEVPLAELMSLEEGDVLPLDLPASGRATLTVENHPCAVGRLGSRSGHYAIRIEEVLGPPPLNEKTS